MLGKHRHHLIAFVLAQQSVVHEHTGQLVANGLVQQRRHDRRIDTAGQAQQHFVFTHLGAHPGDHVVDDIAGGPQSIAAANFADKPLEDFAALLGVGHFRMELHAVETLVGIFHRRDRAAGRERRQMETVRQFGDLVTVAHPHIQLVGTVMIIQAIKQGDTVDGGHFGITEFPQFGTFHLAAQLLGHGLHAVADAQYRHAQFEHHTGRPRGVGRRHRFRAAGQDDAVGVEPADIGFRYVVGPEFAINTDFPHPARDQLGVLGSEIKDQDALGVNIGHGLDSARLDQSGVRNINA